MRAPSRAELHDQADALCEVVRDHVLEHGCEIVVHVNEMPLQVWEEQTGFLIGPSCKRELVGPHAIQYWKEGA